MISWFFGDADAHQARFEERHMDGPSAAPILRLCDAIIRQAIIDGATRIRYVLDPLRRPMETVQTKADYDRIQERLRQERIAGTPEFEFKRIMAEANVSIPERSDAPETWLVVDYEIAGHWIEAITIPPNITDPLIRRLAFHFNYAKCVSLESPENMLYVNGYFCSISHYNLNSSIRAEVKLEHDPEM